jgi:hypothetical protein
MVELHILLSIFLLSLLSFFDFIIFNEEILLTLCFLSFLFYCFNTLSESVFSSFESRAAKFEEDLLLSFGVSKTAFISDFNAYSRLQYVIDQFIILMHSILHFLSQSLLFLEYKSAWVCHLACLSKLNELLVINKNFINSFQKLCVVQLLYSLILKKSTNDLTFLEAGGKTIQKSTELKNLSII